MSNLKPKEPLVAVMLSIILTGLGQIYASRVKRGILFFFMPMLFVVVILSYILNPTTQLNIYSLIPLLILIFFGIFVIVDAYRCAKAYNISNNLSRNITAGKRFLIIIGILLFMFIFNPSQLVRSYFRANVVQAFKIASETMNPTLIKGDRVLVDKAIYKKSEPERGDLVVFKYPEDSQRSFIKRVVGLPNETIEIKNGRILINGVAIKEPAVLTKIYYYNKGDYGKAGQVTKISNDSYYVLGDNSNISQDSRYWGLVPKEYLEGKAYKIYFPFNRSGAIK